MGGRPRGDAPCARGADGLIAFVDTNVLIRHLTGAPREQAARASAVLARAERLLVTDVVFAECVFVLESFYELSRDGVAARMRSLLALPTTEVTDASVLRRAVELYEVERLHFAEAHLVAEAEATDVGTVLSFDRAPRRAESVAWIEP